MEPLSVSFMQPIAPNATWFPLISGI